MIKIAVLGGSGVATPELVAALIEQQLQQPLELALIGRTADKLEKVASACRRLVDGHEIEVTASTDTERGLDGANFVINQVRVGGLKARAFDETFPHEFGFPGEETVGPGGFANATRTVPVVLGYARQVERLAPEAVFVNFTNPTSFIQYAISRYTKVTALGLCDSPVSLVNMIAAALDLPAEELSVDYVGMHHFGWVTAVYWKGHNLMTEVLARAARLSKLGVEPEAIQALGAVPHPYYRYFVHGDAILEKQRGQPSRALQLASLQDEMLSAYESPDADVLAIAGKRGAVWYRAVVAPVLAALMESRSAYHIVNVVNGQTLPWLPSGAIIETPALLQQGRVRPLPPQDVPANVRALVQHNCAFEMAAVEAIVERSYDKALRALLLHPMRLTYQQAKGVLERIWPDAMPV